MPASSSTTRMLCMLGNQRRMRRFKRQRKFYDKPRANWLIFFDANRPMVIFHDATYNRKPEVGASFLGREIRQKELFLQFTRDIVPCIRNYYLDSITAGH